MEIIHFPQDSRPSRWTWPVTAVGNFDGMHRGHLKIVESVARHAAERGATPIALTFDPHPPRIVRPDKAPPLLMTLDQKIEALGRAGTEAVAIVRFTLELSRWEPEEFVRAVLVDWLRVSEVWVGANFLFGHDRSGNYSVLRALGTRYGFRAEQIEPVRYKEFVVSSTRIRRLVGEGRVDEAGVLLGHHYCVDGTVVRGAGRGRLQGFPTANLFSENELLPPRGVYACIVTIEGIQYPAVANIGIRPTFGGDVDEVVEAHIFGVDRDLYGMRVRMAFVQRLREERRFPDAGALRVQIDADCRQARALFDRISL